jgi:hypothetical protein
VKRSICVLLFLVVSLSSILIAENNKIIMYIPSDGEIQYYMNLYERLKAIEIGKMEYKQLRDMYEAFENTEGKYFYTYQKLLLESYLLCTKNPEVRNYMIPYLGTRNSTDRLAETLINLYKGKEEKYKNDGKEYTRFLCANELIDENINLFKMQEITTMNDKIGLMLFDNDWSEITLNDDKNPNMKFISYIYGGGTNTISISIKQYEKIDFETFNKNVITSDFYKVKYGNYVVRELDKAGILARAGADKILLGVGSGKDIGFPDIINASAVLFMYSETIKAGYQIEYFMNISPKNNNYNIQDLIFNHMLFQCLLAFIN